MATLVGPPYDNPFITYRHAHQIFEKAAMQGNGSAGAIEAVRLLVSDPESDAVKFEKVEKSEPIVEYQGVGELAALFRPGQLERTSELSGIVLGARPDFIYQKEPFSDAISMQEFNDIGFNFSSAMLAVSIQDGGFGVSVPLLQWNIRLSLVWTRVRVLDGSSFLNLAFQWRFHEHPHPLQLLVWSLEWQEFVRDLRMSSEQRLERIAYGWIYYQLKWLETCMRTLRSPLKGGASVDWSKELTVLLNVKPPEKKDDEWKAWYQDWRTQTLPLLARPELGLPLEVQRKLLEVAGLDAEQLQMQREWLKDQRRRLVTDAIIAAGDEDRRPVENPEDTKRVERIVEELERRQVVANGCSSPWQETVERPAVEGT